ncbi:putative bifunctional diguanylate cyclase/phosphodiesterase [Pseudovibrio sp. SPO723]|uniref:putative bifunctional diguanylate cyclase/phosphodiesterase n=1 Tax=Nesiotobacter zosterae TaxID=392721 RepID=UPI0029C364C1|nr:EAL domain-containing protein [Pseudovibrio sp. SPO723]MDX5594493.1 EAL domain-containing protein [Pseudovibrio sp. SPO723]
MSESSKASEHSEEKVIQPAAFMSRRKLGTLPPLGKIPQTDARVLAKIEIPVYVLDLENIRITWANRAGLDFMKLDSDTFNHQESLALPAPFSDPAHIRRLRNYLLANTEDEERTESVTVVIDGQPTNITCAVDEQPFTDGRLGLLVQVTSISNTDVSQLRIAQALLFTNSMISMYTESGELIYENPVSRLHRPKSAANLPDRFCNDRDYHAIREALQTRLQTNLVCLMKAGEGNRWHDVTARRGHDPVTGEQTILISAIDVTKRLEAEHEVRYLAHHDTLTGLPNRTYLEIAINRHLDEAELNDAQGAMLFVDLDRFKTINDTLGHLVGDDLLIQVAKRLEAIGKDLGFVARLGGDEFVLLLSNFPDHDLIEEVAEHMRQELSRPYVVGGHNLQITLSVGVALYPEHGRDLDTLMRKADLAMYRAKDLGRDRYCFFNTRMAEDAEERLRVENALRHAINNDEFELHYQPRLNAQNNHITGAESLLRWHHPSRGLISAGVFIEVAEETGLIDAIGEWVAENAMRQQKAWEEQGYPVTLSINLSPAQFKREPLPEILIDLANKLDITPSRVKFEITESLLLKETATTLHQLTQLRDAGFQLEIDDFGTGYSNLGYLQRYPVSALKIDRSFISDRKRWPIVQMITQMGRLLNLSIVAEGIETLEQLAQIRTVHCQEYQGFLYSPAVSADEFLHLLKQDRQQRRTARRL